MKNKIQEYLLQLNHPELDQKFISEKNIKLIAIEDNKINLSIIIKNAKVPIIVDAGIGTASDATVAMELGCDGVLVNSAIAKAKNSILMAESFKNSVISGRQAFLAGRMKKLFYADPSSPT